MNLENQILFFFSALGAFNGFLLSFYFAYKAKKSGVNSNYFLSLLMLVLSIRIVKSVFFYFNPNLSLIFIQIGLSACFLIGPSLYLYIKSQTTEIKNHFWLVHLIPYLLIIIIISIVYPDWYRRGILATYFIRIIYLQWLIYLVVSGVLLKKIIKKKSTNWAKLGAKNVWLISIYFGILFIWIAYNVGSFTSYIVGALSFSLVLYLVILVLIFKRNKKTLFFDEKAPYKNKHISTDVIEQIQKNLRVIKDKMLFKNPDLKMYDVAKELNTSQHVLSQYLNENLGKSFSLFINEYRIEEAKKLLLSNNNFTIEAIGYESGFNSKSTFFSTFKNIVGVTPSAYSKQKQ